MHPNSIATILDDIKDVGAQTGNPPRHYRRKIAKEWITTGVSDDLITFEHPDNTKVIIEMEEADEGIVEFKSLRITNGDRYKLIQSESLESVMEGAMAFMMGYQEGNNI